MRLRDRNDVVEVAWANGDRFYGKGPRLRVGLRACIARYVFGRRS